MSGLFRSPPVFNTMEPILGSSDLDINRSLNDVKSSQLGSRDQQTEDHLLDETNLHFNSFGGLYEIHCPR